jgi:DNA-binding NtrC family response regulator
MTLVARTHSPWPQIPTATSTLALRDTEALCLADASGEARPLCDRLTIGQSRENDVVLEDPTVSRRHSMIVRVDGAFHVRDLESKNGTFLNEVLVSEARLYAGCTLRVGNSTLRIVGRTHERSPLLGGSAAMRRLRRSISMLAPTRLPLLIFGETGTGKELVARALHEESGRAGAFVALNCGAIASELVESELFGHERGAFTGATQRRLGVFQEADGGTLFLDEIGELPLSLQPRLLRALEVGGVRPVGAARELRVEVRVVAATHVDLEDAVRKGRFREDLYYRLRGDLLRTPALRDRPDDIVLLAERFLTEENARATLDESALAALTAFSWPGNVRELRNVLRRATALSGPIISAGDLALRDTPIPQCSGDLRIDDRPFLDIEREILQRALQRSGGNKRAAAQALGIPKSTLCDKAKRYGIG